jgi:hypothetical protein
VAAVVGDITATGAVGGGNLISRSCSGQARKESLSLALAQHSNEIRSLPQPIHVWALAAQC